jgi:hypothetical protein
MPPKKEREETRLAWPCSTRTHSSVWGGGVRPGGGSLASRSHWRMEKSAEAEKRALSARVKAVMDAPCPDRTASHDAGQNRIQVR